MIEWMQNISSLYNEVLVIEFSAKLMFREKFLVDNKVWNQNKLFDLECARKSAHVLTSKDSHSAVKQTEKLLNYSQMDALCEETQSKSTRMNGKQFFVFLNS